MKKKIFPYNPALKKLARQLRENSTISEVLLWGYLKGKQIFGYDFDRQKPIDNYIVDFFCNELMLAIEIDGETHNDKGEEDKDRQARLEQLGIRFLRFTDMNVKHNIEGVLATIENWVKKNTEPTPTPPRRGLTTISSPLGRGRGGFLSREGCRGRFSPLERGAGLGYPLLGGV